MYGNSNVTMYQAFLLFPYKTKRKHKMTDITANEIKFCRIHI